MQSVKHFLKKTFLGKIIKRARGVKRIKTQLDTRLGGLSREDKKALASDIYTMIDKYGFSIDEYIYLGFKDLSIEERLRFVPDRERISYTERMNKKENQEIFDNKAKTYQCFGTYFKRSVAEIKDRSSLPEFAEFLNKHKSFIVKPIDAYCGKGIEIIKETKFPTELFESLIDKHKNGFVIEELVVQTDEMARFHPNSCNTVRIPTVRFDDRVEIIHPFFRIGRGGAIVDNAGAGGIIVAVDAKTGITIAAADERGNIFDKHPDTACDLIGVQIPRWNELIELAKEVAMVIPSNRYTGWDFALTDNGWVMIEGNARGQFVWQVATRVGFREEIENILKELNL